MPVLRHALTGGIYELQPDGAVRVDEQGRIGLFERDGRWRSGELRHADPHLIGWLAGALRQAGDAFDPAAAPAPESGGTRARSISYQQLLDTDSKSVPAILREESAGALQTRHVPIERYTSRAFHELEVERLWKRVWQMACREEELPEVGDHIIYDIADLSVVVVRSGPGEIRAFHNSCLHRGRQLCQFDGHAGSLRCPFHGWTWNLDGTLAEIPCRWDFAGVERDDYRLPEVKIGTWGGFVFINPDTNAAPLADHLGDLPRHFARWPLEHRYKEVHVAKVLPCNWKVAQEAFMEAYHVVATHPQLLAGIGDANSQYDVWESFSRAITANATPSPHLGWEPSQQDMFDAVVQRELDQPATMSVPDGGCARAMLAEGMRMQLQSIVPGAAELSDAEMLDSFYYTVFPNFHPWGAYNRIVYRFRPLGNDPDHSIMEVMYLAPFSGARPAPAKVHWLAGDEDWTKAPELGFLGRVFNQDTYNLGCIQRGLHAAAHSRTTLGEYQERKIRHFHDLLERYLRRAAP